MDLLQVDPVSVVAKGFADLPLALSVVSWIADHAAADGPNELGCDCLIAPDDVWTERLLVVYRTQPVADG